jgi:hypothetical protein
MGGRERLRVSLSSEVLRSGLVGLTPVRRCGDYVKAESLARALEPFERVLLEHGDRDSDDLHEFLAGLGYVVEGFREKAMVRGQFDMTALDLIVGGVPTVRAALRRLGRDMPEPNDYPAQLTPFLRRRIWGSTIAGALATLERGHGPVFVKPRGRLKRFTGRVASDASGWPFASVSGHQAVWCSEVVEWLSEHRVFVARGEILDIRPYFGDTSVLPDDDVVGQSLEALSETAPAGFALDVGVLSDGSTAIVEMNDGFAIGRYGLSPRLYIEVLAARWHELVTTG